MATEIPELNPTHEPYPTNPVPPPVQHEPELPWSTGLCDCFSNVSNCCMTCWCPCVTYGRIAEIVDRGSSSMRLNAMLYMLVGITSCACLFSCVNRSKMRRQYKLKGNDCTDCLTHYFCEGYALCQEYRELKNRGFDPKLACEYGEEKYSGSNNGSGGGRRHDPLGCKSLFAYIVK